MAKKGEVKTKTISLKRLERNLVVVPIVGITPLIMHKWSEKARQKMLSDQLGQPKTKEPRKPEEEYEACFYRDEEGKPAMPTTAFKSAIVDASRFFDNLNSTDLRRMIFMPGEWVRIEGEPRMRWDMVRNQTGVADMRFRPEFPVWWATLRIEYLDMTVESILALVDASGNNGTGEWRPSAPRSKNGNYGRYQVDWDKLKEMSK